MEIDKRLWIHRQCLRRETEVLGLLHALLDVVTLKQAARSSLSVVFLGYTLERRLALVGDIVG